MGGGERTLVGVLVSPHARRLILACILTPVIHTWLADQFDTIPGDKRSRRALGTLASPAQQPRWRANAYQSQPAIIHAQYAPIIGKTDIIHTHGFFLLKVSYP